MTRDILAERREIDRAVEGQTVCSLFQETVRRFADAEAMKWKEGEAWRGMTWAEYGQRVRELANGLFALGFEKGQFATILGSNRPEYYVADLGILHAGGVPVSLYNTLSPEQIEYIVNHCEAVLSFVENRAFYEKLAAIRDRIPRVRRVVVFEKRDVPKDDWAVSLEEVLELGRRYEREHPDRFEKTWQAVRPEDLATLIYTSGTTGPPKGVMVTHRNVAWTTESLERVYPRRPGMRHISYLPLAHIAERMTGHYLHLKGASLCYFCPAPQEIAAYLLEVRPQFFFAVPRIWEKMYYGLTSAIEGLEEAQKKAVQEAITVRLEVVRREQRGEEVPEDLRRKAEEAEPIVALVRARLGLDQVELASTGAAPIAPEILEWFHAIGIPIAEVYGQSEDTGPTSWNRPGRVKIGTVGPTIPGVEVKLAEDGELLVRGGNVTAGYYKEPELTAETFDAEGWLHSGDVAEIDEEGFLRIVDRKKEILITAGGKNIAPSNIENALKQKPLIGQACVVGDRRPYVTALLVLDPESARQWARERGLPEDLEVLARHPDVHREIQRYVDEVNEKLSNVERIKKFAILPTEWTVDSGELTPTLKMKRKVVHERYADVIESLYRG
ncbi:MAG: long-chain acyl-CoA synthetase [Candidatus Binatia bacterium]|nr:MAG: long-chain acyl-CoA synthetase [Candidatus Binatia bacterium]